ncbi:hypothetical protein [Burkholderia sp. BCC1972]|uniref:hypothetical protein n=1 Tax=Burkholderia sp. BCC1972 TaxID=2817438 RepID=UPI002ABE1091|nr:hypothetical protein [Burkholderia sp. BCC1972]
MCASRIALNEIAARLEARQRAARTFRKHWRSARASAISPLPDRSAGTAARSSMVLRISSVIIQKSSRANKNREINSKNQQTKPQPKITNKFVLLQPPNCPQPLFDLTTYNSPE